MTNYHSILFVPAGKAFCITVHETAYHRSSLRSSLCFPLWMCGHPFPHLLLHILGPPPLLFSVPSVCTYSQGDICICVWRPEEDGRYFPYHSLPCQVRQGISGSLKPTIKLSGITNGWSPGSCLPLPLLPQHWNYNVCPASTCLLRIPTQSGPYVSTADALRAAISWVWNPLLYGICLLMWYQHRTQGRMQDRQGSTTMLHVQPGHCLTPCLLAVYPPTIWAKKNQK